jgi:hypothetical protein
MHCSNFRRNSAHLHGANVPVVEPSTASETEAPISFDNLNGLFANMVRDRHPERLCCPQVDAHVE